MYCAHSPPIWPHSQMFIKLFHISLTKHVYLNLSWNVYSFQVSFFKIILEWFIDCIFPQVFSIVYLVFRHCLYYLSLQSFGAGLYRFCVLFPHQSVLHFEIPVKGNYLNLVIPLSAFVFSLSLRAFSHLKVRTKVRTKVHVFVTLYTFDAVS